MTLLQPVGDSLWLIDGPVVRAYGVPFPTRMAVARLSGGGLWLWSPVRLTEEVQQGIRSLGDPLYAVEPNKLHHLALAEWVTAWPSLRLYAPPGLANKRRDLRFVAELTDEPPPEWRDEIEQVRIEGNVFMTEVFFFHRPSSTCLVGDLIQKHDEQGKHLAALALEAGRRRRCGRRHTTRRAVVVHSSSRRARGHLKSACMGA